MISVIIPNYNSAVLLKENLPKLVSLLEKSKLDYEILVSDDASTDNSCEVVETTCARGDLAHETLRFLSKTNNEGFASTVDRGIRAARGEVVFVLKTDVLPARADYFSIMLQHFDLEKNRSSKKNDSSLNPVFAVSAALQTIENGKEEIRGQGIIIFHRGLFQHFRTFADYLQWLSTMRSTRHLLKRLKRYYTLEKYNTFLTPPSPYSLWADGGALALRKDLYEKIGGFDQIYNPFYWEDTDLSYRAWKAGYQIHFEPRARLKHTFESGSIRRHYSSSQIEAISLRNQLIFTWKNADLWHLFLYELWEPYHLLISLKNRHWVFFKAYWQFCQRLPLIFLARLEQKKYTKLSDSEVLALFQS